MLPNDVMFAVFLISQICIGFLGNSGLLVFYTYTYFLHVPLRRPIDLIFIHLTLVNIFTIMIRLMPAIMSTFGISHFLDDVGCHVTSYMFRVTRGLSICTTSLLSLFQAITISPSHSSWVWLKSRTFGCIFPSLFSFWIINMFLYSHIILALTATRNSTTSESGYYNFFCEPKPLDEHSSYAFLSSMIIRDGVFIVFMVWSSLYMVILLYRHHNRVRCVLRPNLSSPSSPEIKATKRIIVLVTCFVFFYCLNNVMTFHMLYSPENVPHLDQINGVLSSGYPTLCPFVLMQNSKIPLQCPQFFFKVRPTFCHRAINSRKDSSHS